jgi:transcription-repair coupling factor (superfamily II helicase)
MRDGGPPPPERAAARRTHAALGPTLARLWDALAQGDVLAIVADEVRAEAVARAAAKLGPASVLHLPPPDALPGEDTASSPATAGKRFAALAALRRKGPGPRLLVTDAVAAAHLLPPPAAFATPVRLLKLGDRIDREALAQELEIGGYLPDERIDEPGEVAIRGGAIDIFPADADRPVRIVLEEDRIVRITAYDAVTQLGTDEFLEAIALTPAVEPPFAGAEATIFDHIGDARVALDPEAAGRRDSFLRLAHEAGGEKAGARLVRWEAEGPAIDLAAGAETPSTRFVEARRPDRALLAALREERAAGQRVLVLGSPRDLRFLARRIEERLGEAPARWTRGARCATRRRGRFSLQRSSSIAAGGRTG